MCWTCSNCGTEQGKNSMWFEGDLCEVCNSLTLTSDEKIFLDNFIPSHSQKLKRESGLDKISGGFCTLEFNSCNANEIVLYGKIGSADEGGNYSTPIEVILDRKTLTVV